MDCMTSTLTAVNTANQVLTAGDLLPLNQLEKTGCNISFNGGTTPIYFKHKGVYLVSVSADILGTVAGNVTLQLLNNLTEVQGAGATVTTAVGDSYHVAFTTIIPSLCCPNSAGAMQGLQLEILENNATVTNVTIAVVKVG